MLACSQCKLCELEKRVGCARLSTAMHLSILDIIYDDHQLRLNRQGKMSLETAQAIMDTAALVYAEIFFSFRTFFGLNTASCPVILLPSARSSFAPNASLLISSFFSWLTMYRCCWSLLSSRRSNPAFHDLMSWARGSPAVEEAVERWDGAIDGVRVGVAL